MALLDPTTRIPLALLELKFWAALTDAQPAEYLGMLDHAAGGCLCFVAPSARHPALWKELVDRAGFTASSNARHLATRGATSLRLIGWEELLAPIAAAVGGTPMLADLDQLKGLVRDFESAEFRPFHSQGLSNLETPRLILALADVAEAIARQAEADGTVTIGRLRPSHSWYTAGRYLKLVERAGGWLGVNHENWARFGLSPLWLEFRGSEEWSARRFIRNALPEEFGGMSPTAFELGDGNLVFAVPVPLQAERSTVVTQGAEWLRVFGRRLIAVGVPHMRRAPTGEIPLPGPASVEN